MYNYSVSNLLCRICGASYDINPMENNVEEPDVILGLCSSCQEEQSIRLIIESYSKRERVLPGFLPGTFDVLDKFERNLAIEECLKFFRSLLSPAGKRYYKSLGAASIIWEEREINERSRENK